MQTRGIGVIIGDQSLENNFNFDIAPESNIVIETSRVRRTTNKRVALKAPTILLVIDGSKKEEDIKTNIENWLKEIANYGDTFPKDIVIIGMPPKLELTPVVSQHTLRIFAQDAIQKYAADTSDGVKNKTFVLANPSVEQSVFETASERVGDLARGFDFGVAKEDEDIFKEKVKQKEEPDLLSEDYITTSYLLNRLVSLPSIMPELIDHEKELLSYLLEQRDKTKPFRQSLEEVYLKEVPPILQPKFKNWIEFLDIVDSIRNDSVKWMNQIQKSSESNTKLSADELIPMSIILYESSLSSAQDTGERSQTNIDNAMEILHDIKFIGTTDSDYALISSISTLKNAMRIKNRDPDALPIGPNDLKQDKIDVTKAILVREEIDKNKKDELVLHLLTLRDSYQQLGRIKHIKDIEALIQNVGKSPNYVAALTHVEKAFIKEKEHFESGRFLSKPLRAIGIFKIPSFDFKKELVKEKNDFQYPKFLALELENAFERNPALLQSDERKKLKMEISGIKTKIDTLHWPPQGDEKKVFDQFKAAVVNQLKFNKQIYNDAHLDLILYRLMKNQDLIQTPNLIKTLFPNLQLQLKLSDKEFDIIITDFLKNLTASNFDVKRNRAVEKIMEIRTERVFAGAVRLNAHPQREVENLLYNLAHNYYGLKRHLQESQRSLNEIKTPSKHPSPK